MTQYEATLKVVDLKRHLTDQEVADIIGITRQTLYKRLKLVTDWKKSELVLIKQIKSDEYIRKQV